MSGGTKLFVGNLSFKLSEQELGQAFEKFGEITEVKIIFDRETRRPRGFGFISFTNPESATNAQRSMDGFELYSRNLRVSYPNNE